MKTRKTTTKTKLRDRSVLLTAALAVSLTVGVSATQAQEEPEFSETWVRIEMNTTDGDAGFQAMIDGSDWRKVTIRDPDREKVYRVKGTGSVLEQGLTENFFESAEPPCSEQPLDDFLQLFPAGEYRFRGRTTDDDLLKGESILTHELPGAPESLSPSGGGVDASAPVTLSWAAGDTLGNCPPQAVQITPPGDVDLYGYEVVVIREVPEPAVEFIVSGLDPSETSVTLPAELLIPNAIYKFEVVAIEARLDPDDEVEKGNQTITEGLFCTTGVDPCELPE